jgi:hypothetical protein
MRALAPGGLAPAPAAPRRRAPPAAAAGHAGGCGGAQRCVRTRAASKRGFTAAPADVAARVSAALRGTSVFVVGDNSLANEKLCDALATSLGCGSSHRAAGQRAVPAAQCAASARPLTPLVRLRPADTRRCTPRCC